LNGSRRFARIESRKFLTLGLAMSSGFSDPETIAKKGQEIYDRQYRSRYEGRFTGQFVAIDIESEKSYLGANPEEAVTNGKRQDATGIFHLVRVGSVGAFRVSHI
jgi:hypothetical protein